MASPAHRTVLLDLDGTLTDPFEGISRCIVYALERLGLPAPGRRELRSWIGPPLMLSFEAYFRQLGRGDAGLAVDYYRERFSRTGLFENTVYAGVPGLMAGLVAAGYWLCLATAKPAVYAERIVAHFGLDQWLWRSYGSELGGARTDKVELLRYIVKREQIDPGRCIMVGDREHDMGAARYHGMRAIGVLWGYGSAAELLQAGAERLAPSPAQLLRLL